MFDLVLASRSPRRQELLAHCGYSFTVLPPDVDESRLEKESVIDYVKRVTCAKAAVVSLQHPDIFVLSADTIVVIDEYILGKPSSHEDSIDMLTRLSGRSHDVYTAFCIAHNTKKLSYVEVVKTVVTFSSLSIEDIKCYAFSEEGQDKAGGYGIQNSAIRFVEKIEGSPSNVIGLPLVEVKRALDLHVRKNVQ